MTVWNSSNAGINIVDFTAAYVEQAAYIAKENYEEERGVVPTLPPVDAFPNLNGFAENNLGVAAVDGTDLLGFFCWFTPWENHFGLCKGTWSPIHAHGTVKQNRVEIYDRLYQSVAEKLVSSGVFSHAVTLYTHDTAANESFYQNGFGRRCVDAIRETVSIAAPNCTGVTFRQAEEVDAEVIAEMSNSESAHLSRSPIFMPCLTTRTTADIAKAINGNDYQYFIAHEHNRPVAYYRIHKTGENFACNDNTMMNICGAYALPEVRGKGVSVGLLSWLMAWLRERGYLRCGVDFECFNFTARKFWLKYFTAYTNSVIRRIDERS